MSRPPVSEGPLRLPSPDFSFGRTPRATSPRPALSSHRPTTPSQSSQPFNQPEQYHYDPSAGPSSNARKPTQSAPHPTDSGNEPHTATGPDTPGDGSPFHPNQGGGGGGGFLSKIKTLRGKTSRMFSSSRGKQPAPAPAPLPSDPSATGDEPSGHCPKWCSCRENIKNLQQDLAWTHERIDILGQTGDEPRHSPEHCSCRDEIAECIRYLKEAQKKINKHEDALRQVMQWVDVTGEEEFRPEHNRRREEHRAGDGAGDERYQDDDGRSAQRHMTREATWYSIHNMLRDADVWYLKSYWRDEERGS